MNAIRKIAKNTIALFSAQFFVAILALILSVSIARKLGDISFGKYSFVNAFVAIFGVFTDLGYNTLLIRDVSRDRSIASEYVGNVIIIRLILSLVIAISIIIISNILNYSQELKLLIYIFGLCTLIASLSAVFKVLFRAFEKMEYEAFVTIIREFIRVSFGLLVLYLGYGLIELALGFLFTYCLELLISYYVCRKKILKPTIKFQPTFLRNTMKVALPLATLSIFSLIYIRIDTVMLSALKNDAVVGWYNAAYNLILNFKPIPLLIMNALFPMMSNSYISSKETLKVVYEKIFKYLFIAGIVMSTFLTIFSEEIIIGLYGEQFRSSIIILKILSWDILLIFMSVCLAFVLVTINKQKQMACIAGYSALLNIMLNSLLIPKYSYTGAALATIVTEAILVGSYISIINKNFYRIPIIKITTKPTIISLIMGISIYCSISSNSIVNLFITSLGMIVLYLILGVFTKQDHEMFIKAIKRNI